MNPNHPAVVPYQVGNWYAQQNGKLVQLVGVHNPGKHHETMYSIEDNRAVNRYTRRDYGRVTGTCHEYSDPRNIPPMVTLETYLAREKELMEIIANKAGPYEQSNGKFDVHGFFENAVSVAEYPDISAKTGIELYRLHQLADRRQDPATELETCLLDMYYVGHVRA